MKIPDEVFSLIREEQIRQSGKFIPEDDIYLKKLSENAELIAHISSAGCSGYVFFYCNDPLKLSSYITLIGVSPNSRRMGLGEALVNFVLKVTSRKGFKFCTLEVAINNIAAFRLYQSLGFEIVETRGAKYLMRAVVG